jgi:hypothetical protein
MDEDVDSKVISQGVAQHPDAAILVLPRHDGQYSHRSPDILGLLDEVKVAAVHRSRMPRP